ncbi:hypothetical protein VTL71DRAFT_1678 [Oculimacula yallundae]|uniref:Uncharacterized protein n=1 Tax=Oculimacula yallundae TaxID=86028 RepID=A0ABR4CBC6_9HELO
MRFFTLAVPIALSFITGANAWTQAANGVWVANNNWYSIGGTRVHEACTRMNTETILWGAGCAYWTNGQGGIHKESGLEMFIGWRFLLTLRFASLVDDVARTSSKLGAGAIRDASPSTNLFL